ncbi:hypothetical protein [Streptomyces sp. NBC_00280]|uniref:hypothetical protein n=1 Tax=Streptomyces sp. NBC_00280 TaxID=2975699 RepID=UPI00352E5499
MTETTLSGTGQIPERPDPPLVGRDLDIPRGVNGLLHVSEVATERGPLFGVRILGNEIDPASGLDLFAALGDENRFRTDTHPGPGTACNDEPDWRKAHDTLPPASSPHETDPLTEPASAKPVGPETIHEQVTAAGRGVLDLLERHRVCELPVEAFLELVPVLRSRHHSVSSSAEATPGEVDLMVSLLAVPHRSGQGTFHGIGSNCLRAATAGDTLQTRVQACGEAFRLPVDASTPTILVSAGTGPAPFRGAVLDRLRTRSTGTLLCFFDCDHPDADYPHREEFEAAEAAGAVSMRPAFSQGPQGGARFVHDRIAKESDEVWAVLEGGGRIHICGDKGRRTLPAVREAFMAVYRKYTGAGKEESNAWLYALIESGYYVENVRAEPHSLTHTATR